MGVSTLFGQSVDAKGYYLKSICTILKKKKRRNSAHSLDFHEKFGGAKRDRTADLYNAIVALSQLSYSPLSPCPACNAPIEGVAKTPDRFQFAQCQNTARDMYPRGDTLRKQIFIW